MKVDAYSRVKAECPTDKKHGKVGAFSSACQRLDPYNKRR